MEKAKVSKNNYENATHLFPNKENSWITKVATCSSIENKGIESIWDILKKFQKHNTINGWIEKNRVNQDVFWFHEKLNQVIQNDFYSRIGILEELQELEEKVKNKQIDPFKAAKQLFNNESKK